MAKKSFNISNLRTDGQQEVEGVWVETGVGDSAFRIARFNNPQYRAYVAKHTKPLQLAAGFGQPIDPEKLEEIVSNAIAETILLDWRDIEEETPVLDANGVPVVNEDGTPATSLTPVPFSKATARRFLNDIPDFQELVITHARNASNFRANATRATMGNLSNG